MDFEDLKHKTEEELRELLCEKRENVRELRFKVSERQLKKVGKIKEAKKAVSRILTILGNRQEKGIKKNMTNEQ